MERYPDADVVKAIEAALRIMESEGAQIVRDFDLVGWHCCVSRREDMPGNVMVREGEFADPPPTYAT